MLRNFLTIVLAGFPLAIMISVWTATV